MENENKDESINKFVCYNAEEYILEDQKQFEKICIATYKKPEEVKKELHMYHLWLAKKEMYPMGKGAAVAGIESWILNADTFKKQYNGTDKQPVGTTKFNAGANQLLERLKGQTSTK